MRVPSSPNQSANPSTPWDAEPVVEESGAVEDANAENLYLMGKNSLKRFLICLKNKVKLSLTRRWTDFSVCKVRFDLMCEMNCCETGNNWRQCWDLISLSARHGAVWGGSAKVGTGPEHPPSTPLNIQQQQPRSAGSNLWRLCHGNHWTVITSVCCNCF